MGVQNFEFQHFWVFRKKNIFWGMKTVDIFCLYLGVISIHFRVSSLGQGTEWGIIFGVAKNSFYWGGGGGVLEIPDYFWG